MSLSRFQESQITLINSSSDNNEPVLVLILNPDNMKNTTITRSGSGMTIYRVDSDIALTKTSLRSPDSDVPLCVLHRKDIVSDKISFAGQKTKKVWDWLKHSGVLGFKFPVTFQEGDNTYIWKSNIVGQLSLYIAQRPNIPIAWFNGSQRRFVDGVMTTHDAVLALQPEAIIIQDIVVMSFLVLEQKSRMEKKAAHLSAGRAAADSFN